MKQKIRKNIELGILFGLICAISLSFARFGAKCDELRENVLRLHIVANSNSDADQQLKLKVRDRILERTSYIFEGCTDLEDAKTAAMQNIDIIAKTANEVISESGFTYTATARIGQAHFDTREYKDFTLPAGEYNSLIVDIGKGSGKNWWCVVFPCVCLPTASEASLTDSVSEGSAQVAENSSKYVMKFKTVELYEEIKQFFKK